jgi:hypothetical protein
MKPASWAVRRSKYSLLHGDHITRFDTRVLLGLDIHVLTVGAEPPDVYP